MPTNAVPGIRSVLYSVSRIISYTAHCPGNCSRFSCTSRHPAVYPANHGPQPLAHLASGSKCRGHGLLGHPDHASHGPKGHPKTCYISHHASGGTFPADQPVLHSFQTYLSCRLLLVGVTLHLHLRSLGNRLHPVSLRLCLLLNLQGFRFSLGSYNLKAGCCLGLHRFPGLSRFRLALFDLLLTHQQILFRILFLHPPEVGIIVRSYDPTGKKLRHGNAVFF